MAELATSAGLPRPEIEERGDCVTVRFRPADYVPPQPDNGELTERQMTILVLLRRSDGALALRDIHTVLGPQTNGRRLREDLAVLKARGLVETTGVGRGARWKSL